MRRIETKEGTKVVVSLAITKDLRDQLNAYARQLGLTQGQAIEKLVKNVLSS